MAARIRHRAKDRTALDARRDRAIDLVRNGATYAEAESTTGLDRISIKRWCRSAKVSATTEAQQRARVSTDLTVSSAMSGKMARRV